MHDRLTEIGAPVTPAQQLTPIKACPSPLRRETYFVSKEKHTSDKEEVDSSEGESHITVCRNFQKSTNFLREQTYSHTIFMEEFWAG